MEKFGGVEGKGGEKGARGGRDVGGEGKVRGGGEGERQVGAEREKGGGVREEGGWGRDRWERRVGWGKEERVGGCV